MLELCTAAALLARPISSPWLYSARDFIEKQACLCLLQEFFSVYAYKLSASEHQDHYDTRSALGSSARARCLAFCVEAGHPPGAHRECPLCAAGSTDRRNTGVKSICRGLERQDLTRPPIELASRTSRSKLFGPPIIGKDQCCMPAAFNAFGVDQLSFESASGAPNPHAGPV